MIAVVVVVVDVMKVSISLTNKKQGRGIGAIKKVAGVTARAQCLIYGARIATRTSWIETPPHPPLLLCC